MLKEKHQQSHSQKETFPYKKQQKRPLKTATKKDLEKQQKNPEKRIHNLDALRVEKDTKQIGQIGI